MRPKSQPNSKSMSVLVSHWKYDLHLFSSDFKGPACRSPICSEKLFTRAAFMPSDADLSTETESPVADSDLEMKDGTIFTKDCKAKGKAKQKKSKRGARRVVLDSDEDDIVSEAESDDEDEDDMSDFIVQSDEDEEDKDAHRNLKKRLGKRKAIMVLDSDEEIEDTPEESDVLFGAQKVPASDVPVKLMPRFLPSTKMRVRPARKGNILVVFKLCSLFPLIQYMMAQLCKLVEERPDEKVWLLVSSFIRQGILYCLHPDIDCFAMD